MNVIGGLYSTTSSNLVLLCMEYNDGLNKYVMNIMRYFFFYRADLELKSML